LNFRTLSGLLLKSSSWPFAAEFTLGDVSLLLISSVLTLCRIEERRHSLRRRSRDWQSLLQFPLFPEPEIPLVIVHDRIRHTSASETFTDMNARNPKSQLTNTAVLGTPYVVRSSRDRRLSMGPQRGQASGMLARA
jgi:hypothetical protein